LNGAIRTIAWPDESGYTVRTFQERRRTVLHWLITLVIGGVIGWLASIMMKTNQQMGIILNVVIGIVGSWLGLWIFAMLGFAAYGLIAQVIVQILGAMLLILILKAMKVLK
jgi:uncharacterized membrane protein YeaQ/YmgE (transglycosylase-associated protein family)